MTKRILFVFGVALLLLLAVVLFNTFRFSSAGQEGESSKGVEIARYDTAALHLSQALQIKTVSFGDTLPIDTAEFLKFKAFMETAYPLMHQQLEKQSFNLFSYVFKWEGKDTTAKPYVLMAHTDVVPVEAVAESKWTYPSFSGKIEKDTIWEGERWMTSHLLSPSWKLWRDCCVKDMCPSIPFIWHSDMMKK